MNEKSLKKISKGIISYKKIILVVIIMILNLIVPITLTSGTEKVETWNISATEADNVEATLYSDGLLIISGKGNMKNYDNNEGPWNDKGELIKRVKIESGIENIGEFIFQNCSKLSSITIPETVKSIGMYSFQKCSSLSSIIIPGSVKSIGYATFGDCTSLTNVEIESGVESIGDFAFCGCISLTTIEIQSGVESIGESVFQNCSKLSSITIPESVKSIGDYAFEDCSNLSSITIPGSVKSIEEGVFYNCTSLTTVEIESGVESIGNYAFQNCSKLDSITIPETVKSIGMYSFQKCSSLSSIIIPGSVKSIGYATFGDCTSLTNVGIESGVESIGDYAFKDCSNLSSITIPGSVKSIGYATFSDCTSLTNVEIERGVESIGDYAFEDCSNLSSITIPGSIKSIGYRAFGDCTSLTNVEIENGVESIGGYAFQKCSKLSSITIPGSVKSIGYATFGDCISLKSIAIPSKVTSIDETAFYGCIDLIIYCEEGSNAEKFAKVNNIEYVNADVDSFLNNIKITKAPTKTVYRITENFDKTGMEVTATYNNGKIETLTNYTVTDGKNLALGKTSVTISYTEGEITKTATQKITVIEKELSSIEITKAPTKISYIEGEDFDTAGMKVTAEYDNGTTAEITDYIVIDGKNLTAGKTSITISYTENGTTKIATQAITVSVKELSSIAVTKAPTKISYIEGENFNTAGMKVTATYNNGTTALVTNYTVKDGNNLTAGKTSVTISYTEGEITKTATQAITVSAKELSSIEITKVPTKTSYIEGENFDQTGMKITATYNNGTTAEVTNYTVIDGNNLTEGKTSVTIIYTEGTIAKIVVQEITVSAKELNSIAITKAPTKTNYIEGENFDATGMKVTATYNNGTTTEVTNYTVKDGNNLTAGKTSVTISYTEGKITKTVTQAITVKAKQTKTLSDIEITAEPSKKKYTVGENFDSAGMVVTAIYNDGTNIEVTDNIIIYYGENLAPGQTVVFISYTEGETSKVTEQEITVVRDLLLESSTILKEDSKYKIETEENIIYLTNIMPNTNLENLKQEFRDDLELYVFAHPLFGFILDKGTVSTGEVLIAVRNGQAVGEFRLAVTGDLDGDGIMGDIDLLRLARYKAGLDKNLRGAYLKGANIFKDNNYADDKDLLKMARVLVGLDNL